MFNNIWHNLWTVWLMIDHVQIQTSNQISLFASIVLIYLLLDYLLSRTFNLLRIQSERRTAACLLLLLSLCYCDQSRISFRV